MHMICTSISLTFTFSSTFCTCFFSSHNLHIHCNRELWLNACDIFIVRGAVGRVPDGQVIARIPVRISQGARCCVNEQDTSSSLLSTGSTQENVPT